MRDGRFNLFSRVPAAGQMETGRQQRCAVRCRAGVGEKLHGAPGAGYEEFAKGAERPEMGGAFGGEHIVKDEIGRGGALHGLDEIAEQQPPAQPGING